MNSNDITDRNKRHYDTLHAKVDVPLMVNKIRDLDHFISDAVATDTSWHGLYVGGLQKRLRGLKILELGAGDGLNALTMAALGAEVVAIDISEVTPVAIEKSARELGLSGRVRGLAGDFLQMSEFGPGTFDLAVGKGFLHHLDHATERAFLRKTAEVLKPDGEARFLEPATNSSALDRLRYWVPVPGRPSSLSRRAFKEWKDADPHPARDNSSTHYRAAAGEEFGKVEVICIGCVERLQRLLPEGEFNRSFRRLAFRFEDKLPARCNEFFARSQVIICQEPKCAGVTLNAMGAGAG